MSTIVTPGGAKINDAVPGELAFLVGIQANESGFDYFRDQGSPAGSVGTYGGGAEEGFGAYQFTGPQSSQVEQAVAGKWDPATQDKIAAGMAQGYYSAFGGASNPDVWADVTEAWYGPGTVGTAANDVLTNADAPSSADWANVKAAESGSANLPAAFVYGTGYKGGLTTAQVKKELADPGAAVAPGAAPVVTSATLDAFYPGGNDDPLNWFGGLLGGAVGQAPTAAAAAESALTSSWAKPAMMIGLYGIGAIAGAALIVLGIKDLGGAKDSGGGIDIAKAAELAAVA
jgi:hypothetical protein